MAGPMIRIEGISKRFGSTLAVDRAELEVAQGEFLALLGPSGCGKTTLLRLIAGFEDPDSGSITIGGRRVADETTSEPPDRRSVGMVFQDYALFPHLTVAQNVGFGLPRRERAERSRQVLALVGLCGLGERYPHELSGGQQQRVALARAIAPRPGIVLLDEPWSNIDPLLRAGMRDDLAQLLRALGVTVVFVTHDREEAFSLADRIALMQCGTIVQSASAEELYYRPVSRWAAEFVGAANFLPGRVAGDTVDTPVGRFPVVGPNGHDDVEALVRPELVGLEPCPDGGGEVVSREFRGHDVFYRVRLADGTLLVAQRPSNETIPLGSRVNVKPHTGPIAVFP